MKLRQSTVHRLEEVEQQLKLESKQRIENEKDSRLGLDSLENKLKLYTDESTDTVRQMVSVSQNTEYIILKSFIPRKPLVVRSEHVLIISNIEKDIYIYVQLGNGNFNLFDYVWGHKMSIHRFSILVFEAQYISDAT